MGVSPNLTRATSMVDGLVDFSVQSEFFTKVDLHDDDYVFFLGVG